MNAEPANNRDQQLKRKNAPIVGLQHELSLAHLELSWSRLTIEKLKADLRHQHIARFGPRGETLSDLQLSLLTEEPSVTLDKGAAEVQREPLAEAPAAPKRIVRSHAVDLDAERISQPCNGRISHGNGPCQPAKFPQNRLRIFSPRRHYIYR